MTDELDDQPNAAYQIGRLVSDDPRVRARMLAAIVENPPPDPDLLAACERLLEDRTLTVLSARTRAWAEAASVLLESLASSRGVLARIEAGIDTRFVVVPQAEVRPLLELAAARRFGTADYEALTRSDAQQALLAQLVTAGGTLPRDALDESVEVAHFPLGYRLRDAIVDLRTAGAIQPPPADGGSVRIPGPRRDAFSRHGSDAN